MRNTIARMFIQNTFKIILILVLINNLNSSNVIKTLADKFYFLENSELNTDINDRIEKNHTDILEVHYTPVDHVDRNKSEVGYIEGLPRDQKNNTNNKDFILKDAGDIAAWLLIIIILIPCVVAMSIFFVCCQCVFNWCKPRRHIYSDFAPPLLIRPQSYGRYNPSSNFNA